MGSSGRDLTGKRRSFWWGVGHSAWILPSILCFGIMTGAGFLYIGLRAKRPAWWIPGIAYLVAGVGCFVAFGASQPESLLQDLTLGSLLVVWVGGVIHAGLINRDWLRWRTYHDSPWYGQAPPPGYPVPPHGGYPPPPGYPPPLPPQVSAMQQGAPQYYSPGPMAQPMPAQPVPATAPFAHGGPLDVNLATTEQFAALPGFDAARAHRTVAERHTRQGFGSVEEFAAATNLAPHEFAQIRGMVVCTPPQRINDATPPSSGRVVDV